MANKHTNKSTAKSTASSSRVTRIKASDNSKPIKKTSKTKAVKSTSTPKVSASASKPKRSLSLRRSTSSKPSAAHTPVDTLNESSTKNPLRALGRYFKGAWYELNQVRWPDRPTTWQMTGALLAFTAFFVLLIVVLDSLFKSLFEFILG